ncbi:hypothetical protein C8R45DRAFT_445765 [Mycena sanguinolenta]|nr:hypothetical protein C8R45DRAFT_445765 [Mycena sanguinolenta]
MESPFSSHFNTNYVPSSEEMETIEADLVSRAQELAQIDARICELSAQRDQIQAYIDSHKALISHPRRLPPDIVREIFVACLPTERNAVMSAQEAPLLLCRICSAWRTIAISTPRLWASIHVPFEWVFLKESRMPAIVQWLQRSGACPISLSAILDTLWLWQEQSSERSSSGPVLLRSLADFSARWRHVEFTNFSSHEPEFAGIISPALESIKLTGFGGPALFASLEILKAPTLRSVTLHSWSSEFDDIVLAMPLVWDQLTHLSFQVNTLEFDLQNVLVVLGRCSRLISFEVSLRDSFVPSWAPISLPSLAILIMKGDLRAKFLGHFIEHVSMPRLREFHVSMVAGPSTLFLADLGTRSPHIECLDCVVELASFTGQSLLEALQSLPSLHKLVVSDGVRQPADDSFDDSVTQPADDSFDDSDSCTTLLLKLLTPESDVEVALCAALQELVIRNCQGVEESTLSSFIRRRAQVGFRRLKFEDLMDADMISEAQIEFVRSQDVEISVVDNRWRVVPSPWQGLQSFQPYS